MTMATNGDAGPDVGSVDVLVVGTGPAGAATAVACRRLGLSVALVHRPGVGSGADARPVEHVPSSVRQPLVELGLWDAFSAAGHTPCAAAYTAWGSGDLGWGDDHPAAGQPPVEQGWLVDRRRFARWLRQAALDTGATLHSAASHPLAEGLGFTRPRRPPAGRFTVDATGRRGRLAERFGARRRPADELLALTTVLSPGEHPLEAAPVVLVEAVRTGWWHTAPAPGGRLVATLVTDPTVARLSERPAEQVWAGALAASSHTAARLHHHRRDGRSLDLVPTGVAALDQAAGHRWLAVGDAALALDPLGGAGVLQALQGGLTAARTIAASLLAGDPTAAARYDADIQARFRYHLEARRRIYEGERRWPAATFWRRRTSISAQRAGCAA
ncbi:MAG: tryptophan 7-halogenase [Acidimicrobiales bacterium]